MSTIYKYNKQMHSIDSKPNPRRRPRLSSAFVISPSMANDTQTLKATIYLTQPSAASREWAYRSRRQKEFASGGWKLVANALEASDHRQRGNGGRRDSDWMRRDAQAFATSTFGVRPRRRSDK